MPLLTVPLFLFAEGEVFVYRTAVGIIKLFQHQIKKMDFEEAVCFLRDLTKQVI
jgi:hypothetical protein